MTDQYYSQEKNITETPETVLDNWQAQSSAVANFAPEAAEDLERASQALTKLWENAGAQGNVGDQALIQHLWDIEQRQANKVVQLDATRQAAIAALQHIDEKYTEATSELNQTKAAIQEAIDEGSTDNPLVAKLIESISEHDDDEDMVGLYLQCPGCEASGYGWHDVLSHDAVNDLCHALFSPNAEDVPPLLREELAHALNNFSEQWNKHLDTLREEGWARLREEEMLSEGKDDE